MICLNGGICITSPIEIDTRRDDVRRDEAAVDGLESDEAPHHQPGADEQHERNRHLRADEHAAQPTIVARQRGRRRSRTKGTGERCPRAGERSHRSDEADGDADGEREYENRRIDRDLGGAWSDACRQRSQKAKTAVGDDDA